MHDFYELIVPNDLSEIILHLISKKEYNITLLDINDRIHVFNYGPIDQGDTVRLLTKEKLEQKKLGFSASENKNFLKYFAIIIGYLVPEGDEYWDLYLHLRDISDILNLRYFHKDNIYLLKTLITEHHDLFIKLFGEILKPKYHFLLHYPRIIELLGPIILLWCMRMEAKHKPFKVSAHICNSRINLQ